MSEPTIDEMLEWLGRFSNYQRMTIPIRAILEQHRLDNTEAEYSGEVLAELTRLEELAAIRAFVERVEKRLPEYSSGRGADEWLKNYHRAVKDELAEMEKEAE